MALISCPECGRERVSDTANSCPGCGYNIAEHFKKSKDEIQLQTIQQSDFINEADDFKKSDIEEALEEEEAKKEEKERKRIEWEKEQEAKILRERKALMDAMAKMERLRQEKILKAYKETMLKEKQEWICSKADHSRFLSIPSAILV